MIILKTTSDHLQAVIRNLKYATDDLPTQLTPGDDVLIQVTFLSERQGPPKIRYAWKHLRCYEDTRGESVALWQHRWRFIVEGGRLCRLKRPFDVRDVQVTEKDYGAAVRYVYVEPQDVSAILAANLLVCWE
jgi:hypothetical protein